jgi:hypothetical protein
MNFLQLTQTVKRESGLSGIPPAAYTSASGDDARLFNWINWAARDITLQREDWRWRRAMATGTTSDQVNLAAAFGLTNFANWKAGTRFYKPSAYRVSDGADSEHELLWMDYDEFRKQFYIGPQAAGSAQYWSISPSDELLLGPAPDTAHFVRADYIKGYVDMAADADVPALPTRFHILIVWRALMEYGGYDAASEVYQRAERNYTATWTQLVQSQLEAPSILSKALA